MNTSLEKKELARKLSSIADKTFKNVLVPLLTKSGIRIGDFTIVPADGKFEIRKNKYTYYTTIKKSAAMTIAGLMMKKSKPEEITKVVHADRVAFTMYNNLIFYEHHLDQAINNNNTIKKNLMEFRFDKDDVLYRDAKKILQSSYSKIF